MIYLSAFLILLSLSSIYLLIGCGGKKEEPKKKKAKASESKSKSSSATGSEEKKEAPSEPPKEPEKKEEEPSAPPPPPPDLPQDPTPPSPPPEEGEKAPPSAKPKSVKEDKGKPDPNIKISATTLTWDEKAGQQTLKVTNSNETKQAMKMKSSNNVMFKVNPVFAMIDKGKTIDITIMKSPGVLKAEKIQVLTMACDGTDAQKAYAAKDINPAIATIPMITKGYQGDSAKGVKPPASVKTPTPTQSVPGSVKGSSAKSIKKEKIALSSTNLMWTDKVSQQILYVTNNTDKKQALKMKCSNNNLFKINPVFATIERGKSVLVIVRKSAGAVTVEKIQVLTKPTDDNDPQKAFAKKDVEPLIRDIVMGPKK